MKSFLTIFGAIVAAGFVLISVHRYYAVKDAQEAAAVAGQLAKWNSNATEQIAWLRTGANRAAHAYSYESKEDALRAFGLLDMRISGAERILSGAPEGADKRSLKAAIDDARRCLALAPIPPAAAAAMSAK